MPIDKIGPASVPVPEPVEETKPEPAALETPPAGGAKARPPEPSLDEGDAHDPAAMLLQARWGERRGEVRTAAMSLGDAFTRHHPDPAVDAELLIGHVLGLSRGGVQAKLVVGGTVPEADAATLESLVRRREAREPLQHLTGRAAFRSLELAVGPGVFVPRCEGYPPGVTRPTLTGTPDAVPTVELAELLEGGDLALIDRWLAQADVVEIAEELSRLPREQRAVPFRLLARDRALEVFELLEPSLQQELLEGLRDANVRQLFEDLDPDDRARQTGCSARRSSKRVVGDR